MLAGSIALAIQDLSGILLLPGGNCLNFPGTGGSRPATSISAVCLDLVAHSISVPVSL